MADGSVRQWQFWRAGFWRRPVLVIVAALGLIVCAPLPLRGISDAIGAGRAFDAERLCSEGARSPEPCLHPVDGVLDGPLHTRGPDTNWTLYKDDGGGVLTFDISPSAGLENGARTTVLIYGDDFVAAVVTPQAVFSTMSVGLDGATADTALSVVMLSSGILLLGYAVSGWRRTGSLVAVNGYGWDESRLSRVCKLGVGSVFLVAGLTGALTHFGASWRVAVAIPAFIALLCGLLIARRQWILARRRDHYTSMVG